MYADAVTSLRNDSIERETVKQERVIRVLFQQEYKEKVKEFCRAPIGMRRCRVSVEIGSGS